MNEADVRELVAADPRTREIHAYLKRDGRRYTEMEVRTYDDAVVLIFWYTFRGEEGFIRGEATGELDDAVDSAVWDAHYECRKLVGE